ncbi:DUF6682 family protein [uncultured Amphritea sp.]|uniref:phage adaptor protein n=1 Tax=uncultured Amphritea sp. TaxID=981605 RepID=UPI002614C1A6|nr:DUF6682 family protein [uncultured Amphritea sp.]
MALMTVADVIGSVKAILKETGAEGVRWSNDELLKWLNESYAAIVAIKPDAGAKNEAIVLDTGTKQRIPASGLRLLDVVRNVAGSMTPVIQTSREQIDIAVPSWHTDTPSATIDNYIFLDDDPTGFYVYPPADTGAEIEIIYAAVPDKHDSIYEAAKSDVIKVDDSYQPIMTDYILYRAFSKDADIQGSAGRANMHLQAFNSALGMKVNMSAATSPNNRGQQA